MQIDKVKNMFLADYHVHSTCSFDAKNRMAEMARVSKQRGMAEVCFTDHCDFGVPETMQIGPDSFTLPKQQAHQYIEALEKAPEGIELRLQSVTVLSRAAAPLPIPIAIVISPSIVVIAVIKIGRIRVFPASIIASLRSHPSNRS